MRRRRFARRRVTATMSETDAANLLETALWDYFEEMESDDFEITSFEHAGLLTGNKGLVLTVGDDTFQVSVVRARR